MRLGTFSSSSKRNKSFTASRPISIAGWRMVVRLFFNFENEPAGGEINIENEPT